MATSMQDLASPDRQFRFGRLRHMFIHGLVLAVVSLLLGLFVPTAAQMFAPQTEHMQTLGLAPQTARACETLTCVINKASKYNYCVHRCSPAPPNPIKPYHPPKHKVPKIFKSCTIFCAPTFAKEAYKGGKAGWRGDPIFPELSKPRSGGGRSSGGGGGWAPGWCGPVTRC